MTASGWRADVRAAAPGWLVCRVVVVVAWFCNQWLVDHRLDGVDPIPTGQGLFAWDGAYYRAIAELGYRGADFDAIRFHPLIPLIAANGFWILVLASVGAFFAAAVVHRLVVEQIGDADLARRSATLVGLAPPAFSTVWAYAEGPYLLLAAAFLLLLRRRHWWAAGAVGVLASLARPSGLLLALAAAVEGFAWLRERDRRPSDWIGPLAAVAGPILGLVSFLVWVEREFGEALRPVRIQNSLRGGFALPPLRLVEGVGEVLADPLGDGLHIPFAVLSVFLVWVCWNRRFPWSWTALAATTVITDLAADNLNSTERYAYGCVPLIIALAAVAGGRWWRPIIGICVLGLLGMTTLAWYGSYVP